jgi:hypothetical protein
VTLLSYGFVDELLPVLIYKSADKNIYSYLLEEYIWFRSQSEP